MCTDLHMRDLLLLRGLASGPALALDSVYGGVDSEAWVSVSVPQRVCSLRVRGSHTGALCSPVRSPVQSLCGQPATLDVAIGPGRVAPSGHAGAAGGGARACEGRRMDPGT